MPTAAAEDPRLESEKESRPLPQTGLMQPSVNAMQLIY